MKVKRKIRIDMSVDMDVLIENERPKNEMEEYLNTVAKNYVSCLGDKYIKIEKVEFV